jgi:hypothetical protein
MRMGLPTLSNSPRIDPAAPKIAQSPAPTLISAAIAGGMAGSMGGL